MQTIKLDFRIRQFGPQNISIQTSFDSITPKRKSYTNKTYSTITPRIYFSVKPYNFPNFDQASQKIHSSISPQCFPKKCTKIAQKIQKLENILLVKNIYTKKALNTSYKSQKSQRNQKTQTAFEDLQQIDSLNIKKIRQSSQQIIRINEKQKVKEIIEGKKQYQRLLPSKNRQNYRKLKVSSRFENNDKINKIKQSVENQYIKTHGNKFSRINFYKNLQIQKNKEDDFKIDAWQGFNQQ